MESAVAALEESHAGEAIGRDLVGSARTSFHVSH